MARKCQRPFTSPTLSYRGAGDRPTPQHALQSLRNPERRQGKDALASAPKRGGWVNWRGAFSCPVWGAGTFLELDRRASAAALSAAAPSVRRRHPAGKRARRTDAALAT